MAVWTIGVRRRNGQDASDVLRAIADRTGNPLAPCDMGDSVRADQWSAIVEDVRGEGDDFDGYDLFIDVYARSTLSARRGAESIVAAMLESGWDLLMDSPAFGNPAVS